MEFTNYRDKIRYEKECRIEKIYNELPAFSHTYFNYINRLSPNTRLAYAIDMLEFFQFIKSEYNYEEPVTELPVNCLERPTRNEISSYLLDLKKKLKGPDNKIIEIPYEDSSIKRKLACLKAFYKFYLLSDDPNERIEKDPVSLVKLKALDAGEVLYMKPNETTAFLDNIETREFFNEKKLQKKSQKVSKNREIAWSEKNEIRDVAICMLILDTGLRVSECAALDLLDFDFTNMTIRVYRKGHDKDSTILLSKEIKGYLETYLKYGRPSYLPENEAEMAEIDRKAMWLTRFHKRMGVQAMQNMVKKYEKDSVSKGITFHKLRSTFGTDMATNTKDLKRTQVAMGHSSPTTTSRFYVGVEEEAMREAYETLHRRK